MKKIQVMLGLLSTAVLWATEPTMLGDEEPYQTVSI